MPVSNQQLGFGLGASGGPRCLFGSCLVYVRTRGIRAKQIYKSNQNPTDDSKVERSILSSLKHPFDSIFPILPSNLYIHTITSSSILTPNYLRRFTSHGPPPTRPVSGPCWNSFKPLPSVCTGYQEPAKLLHPSAQLRLCDRRRWHSRSGSCQPSVRDSQCYCGRHRGRYLHRGCLWKLERGARVRRAVQWSITRN